MQIEAHPDDVSQYSTDSRGRIYLGAEFADTEVEVAILGEIDDE